MENRESIFRSIIRTFFVSASVLLGLFVGFMIIFITFALIKETKDEVEPVNTIAMLPDANDEVDALQDDTPIILQLDIDGFIGVEDLKRNKIRTILRESRTGDLKDNRVKGVLLYINTPGGGVIDADEIYQAIKQYKVRYNVPIYAYVEGLCASGGMYIAAAADKIYASDSSLIGSVGVLLPTSFNFSKLMEKVGVESLTITSGKDKDPLNPFRPWGKDEGEEFKKITNYYYKQFVATVAAARPMMDKQKLIDEYGARVFPAPEAQEKGYIDQSGMNRSDVLNLLTKEAGISEETTYQVVRLEEKEWLKKLISGPTALFNGQVIHQIKFSGDIDPALHNQVLYLWRPE